MSAKTPLEIITDGTGGAFAIDHLCNRISYTQSVHVSDLELKHQAVRLLVPLVYGSNNESTTAEMPLWKTVRALEVATRTIFLLVDRGQLAGQEKSWQETLERYKSLVRASLDWQVLPVPFEGPTLPRSGALIVAILHALQTAWEDVATEQVNQGCDPFKVILKATSPPESDVLALLALAKEAYAGRDYGRKRLASFTEYSTRNTVVTKALEATEFLQDALDGAELAMRIADAISTRKPFAFVRVGEGEGCFLSYEKYQERRDGTHEVFGVCAKDIYRVWFDRNIHEASPAELQQSWDMFWMAIEAADVIGVPTPERLVYEYAHFLNDIEQHGYSRGYVGVAEILGHLTQARAKGKLRDTLIADCDIARPLYEWQDWSTSLACTLPRMLKGKKGVTFVTCHPHLGPALQRMLNITHARTLLIPPERGRVKGDSFLAGDHFANHFQRINEELRSDPGNIVLVAAGFLGKAYCATAKASCAVAIDIGSLADYWVGINTRTKNTWSIPSPFQIATDSINHRTPRITSVAPALGKITTP